MKNNAVLWTLLLAVVAAAASLVVGSTLPDVVPTHWNASGHVDAYGSRNFTLWLMPGVMLGISALTWLLPRISPEKFKIEPFAKTYGVVMLLVQGLELAIHLLLLRASGPGVHDLTRWLMPIVFLFFAAMGNWMGKVRTNYFMGVRTPWTLTDERVWDKTHQEAGRLWFFGGILGAIAAALGLPILVSVAVLVVLSFWPILRSYLIAKQLRVV
ncbi:MAG: SdpI family protein [Armatimonadota bacterium]